MEQSERGQRDLPVTPTIARLTDRKVVRERDPRHPRRLYPILHRMLDEGWLADGWEDPAQLGGKRPPRRYYELTDEGKVELGALLQEARSDARFRSLVGRLA